MEGWLTKQGILLLFIYYIIIRPFNKKLEKTVVYIKRKHPLLL
jgi:hypothetical protein